MAAVRAGKGVRRAVWAYGKGTWSGQRPSLGGDEYGRHTLVIPLPHQRALVVAYKVCRSPECQDMREQTERQRRVNADPRTAVMDELIGAWNRAGFPRGELHVAVGLTSAQYQAWSDGDGLPDGYVPAAMDWRARN